MIFSAAAERAEAAERPVSLSGAEASASPSCGSLVCVHWTDTGDDAVPGADEDADGVPDYVEAVSSHAHASLTQQTARAPSGLGWAPPVPDGTLGGSNDKVDAYIDRTAGEGGYAYFADPAPGADPDRRSAFFAVRTALPADFLAKVVTHELNHVLQFGADARQQIWMFEATATWAEQALHGGTAQRGGEVATWATRSREPMIGASTKAYGSRVWNEWLASRYGRQVIAEAWSKSAAADPRRLSAPAYDAAIGRPGAFESEFSQFAVATAEWNAVGTPWPGASTYPDVRRTGTLQADGARSSVALDHTAFALFDVPVTQAQRLLLHAEAPSGLAGAVALVGRPAQAAEGPVVASAFLSPDGDATVHLDDPARFTRLTAVAVNADAQSPPGRGSSAAWHDDQVFDLRLDAVATSAAAERQPTAQTPVTPPSPDSGEPSANVGRPAVRLHARSRARRRSVIARGLLISLPAIVRGRASCKATLRGITIARSTRTIGIGVNRRRLHLTARGRRQLAAAHNPRLTLTCVVDTRVRRLILHRVVHLG